MIKNFKSLEIWKRSRMLVNEVYGVVSLFPDEEKFGLTSQMKRAAISIPSNIAEGCGRDSINQLKHFLHISLGSNCELETQFYLANDLALIPEERLNYFTEQLAQIRMMTLGFIKSLE